MKTHVNLYTGKNIRNSRKLIRSLEKDRFPMGFYIVAFYGEEERLNIFSALLFAQSYYKQADIEIVALVGSKDEAFEYIRGLSEISVERFGEFDARRTIDSMNGADLELLRRKAEEKEQETWFS